MENPRRLFLRSTNNFALGRFDLLVLRPTLGNSARPRHGSLKWCASPFDSRWWWSIYGKEAPPEGTRNARCATLTRASRKTCSVRPSNPIPPAARPPGANSWDNVLLWVRVQKPVFFVRRRSERLNQILGTIALHLDCLQLIASNRGSRAFKRHSKGYGIHF